DNKVSEDLLRPLHLLVANSLTLLLQMEVLESATFSPPPPNHERQKPPPPQAPKIWLAISSTSSPETCTRQSSSPAKPSNRKELQREESICRSEERRVG